MTTHETNLKRVDQIIGAMSAEIEKYALELMQRYPNDLLVHDRRMLETFAVPGAQIAWMVGHCHTHLVALGLHAQENKNVSYLTKLASEDRFYLLKVSVSGREFSLTEKSRLEFCALSETRVPYQRDGLACSGFWLTRAGRRLGTVSIKSVGTWAKPSYHVVLTPAAGITALDLAALKLWGDKAVTEEAQTLFVSYELEVADSIALQDAA